MSRKSRKLEHIKYALETGQSLKTGLNDISFVHNSLPLCSVDDIDLAIQIGELTIGSPIFVNAMTGGGGAETEQINRQLAIAARETGISMSVGSQMSAIREPAQIPTFSVVRKENPNGIIIGNLGGEASADEAKRAVDMIDANALQIHLNVIQELVMPEGDRDFSDILKNIESISKAISVPVIVKEVGFGMSRETVMMLKDAGVKFVDVGGAGGTNFGVIENRRRERMLSYFNDWGISTAASIAEASTVEGMTVLASGGIRNGLDIVKCLSLGAVGAGIAGYFLKTLEDRGVDALIDEIQIIHEDIRMIMTALGVRNLSSVSQLPKVISGETCHWLQQRGII